jgi:hypothetical protein
LTGEERRRSVSMADGGRDSFLSRSFDFQQLGESALRSISILNHCFRWGFDTVLIRQADVDSKFG